MIRAFSISIFLTMFFGFSNAQTVGNKSFGLVLKTLLSHSVPEISPKEAAKQPSAILLDAREEKEYLVSHIQNAIWVGYDKLDLSLIEKNDKKRPIIVYCSVGYRSEKVAEKLIKKGFTNVENLYGGIFEWKNEGNIVVNNKGKTEQVHAYNKMWGIWLKKGTKIYN
jgi:rhodanese-related sulfurtransferase